MSPHLLRVAERVYPPPPWGAASERATRGTAQTWAGVTIVEGGTAVRLAGAQEGGDPVGWTSYGQLTA